MVIVANAGIHIYQENELDIKLLYMVMTRLLHNKLYIYYTGELMPLLNGRY